MAYVIRDLKLTPLISKEFVENQKAAVDGVKELILAQYEVQKILLETVKLFLFSLDPVQLLYAVIREAILDIIAGIKDAKLSAIWVYPSYDDQITTKEAFERLAESVLDKKDLNRPITLDETADINAVFVVLQVPSFENVVELFESLAAIFDVSFLEDILGALLTGDPDRSKESLVKAQGSAPDWDDIKLVELIPFVGTTVEVLEEVVELILPPAIDVSDLIDEMIAAINQKIQQITQFIENIEALLDAYIAIASLDFGKVVIISGAFTQEELSNEILRVREENFPEEFIDICTILGMSSTLPAVTTLIDLFVGQGNLAQDFTVTAFVGD